MKSKNDSGVIEAAGGLIWRKGPSGKQVAVIHRPKYDDWTLPKGKLEKDESWESAAIREIKEETGCDVELESFAGSITYLVGERPKIVLFCNARLTDEGDFEASTEVDQLVWLSAEDAAKKVKYEGERALLNRFIED